MTTSNRPPLSPAAQAVMDAAVRAEPGQTISAALRAVADQVVPDEQRQTLRGMRPGGTGALTLDEAQGFQRAATRRKLLAIAAELEAQP